MRLLILIIGLLTNQAVVFAADGDLRTVPTLARRQASMIAQIEPYVERVDQPKIQFLRQVSNRLLESVRLQGASHVETMQRIQEAVIAYRFSKETFKSIYTEKTAEWIEELQKSAREMALTSGFDQSLYTKITASAFRQLRELTMTLTKLKLPDGLSERLLALQTPIGHVLATAQNGDTRKTLEAGEACLREIVKLYPEFNQISISDSAFNSVMEIQGIGEFYADFIRADDLTNPTPKQ